VTPEEIASIQAMLHYHAFRHTEARLKQADLIDFRLYVRLRPSFVGERKLRSTQDTLTWLLREFKASTYRPPVFWCEEATESDMKTLEEDGSDSIEGITSGPMLACYRRQERDIWLTKSLDGSGLIYAIAHEFAHSIGCDQEEIPDGFGATVAKFLSPYGGLFFVSDEGPHPYNQCLIAKEGDLLLASDGHYYVRTKEETWKRYG
jgi:hypothetical protein